MQLGTARTDDTRGTRAVVVSPRGLTAVADLAPGTFADARDVIERFGAAELAELTAAAPESAFTEVGATVFTAPIPRPRMIWGIGLNYREHATDLSEVAPSEEPASFIKGDHTVIGPGDPIPLPWQSERVTAEAELGLVIGSLCRDASVEDALDHVWGVTTVLDQTAEDILARNPRYLTRSKNFPGFFSFGPLITPTADVGDILEVEVRTLVNGNLHRANTTANMMFPPAELVSFHSQVMPLFPGDILSTGTPGAVRIEPGDVAGCVIPGVGELYNPVVGRR
ncbi:fumarylacetoacetate hydrolase family protein [Actinophytocola sp. S1-96]|uniref:Fumarylacetoacetate hydrolase family protein n=1 Tax=Actinophytocola gossypii TaxID=2812003 RepID=A0ABT2J3F4_9PSEU|nr:fumarylacetoacetate hydrolase family protein [Actinophytocola gossypii]